MLNFAHRYPMKSLAWYCSTRCTRAVHRTLGGRPSQAFRRVSAVLPPLSRLGAGRILYRDAHAGLPALPAMNNGRSGRLLATAAASDEFSKPHRHDASERADHLADRPSSCSRRARTPKAAGCRRTICAPDEQHTVSRQRDALHAHRRQDDRCEVEPSDPRRRECRTHRATARGAGKMTVATSTLRVFASPDRRVIHQVLARR